MIFFKYYRRQALMFVKIQKKRKTSRDESGHKRKRTSIDHSAMDLSADGMNNSLKIEHFILIER